MECFLRMVHYSVLGTAVSPSNIITAWNEKQSYWLLQQWYILSLVTKLYTCTWQTRSKAFHSKYGLLVPLLKYAIEPPSDWKQRYVRALELKPGTIT